jgi:hypothetical protein
VETRRTLEKSNVPRELTASELKVGFCVNLADSENNDDVLFVEKISETEITFESRAIGRGDKGNYRVILTRKGETLHDEKGRAIEIFGKPKQYNYEGKEI